MKFNGRVAFNESDEHRFEQFAEGDTLVASEYVFRGIEAETIEQAADRVWALTNMPTRINGQTERSTSVGDLVVLDLDMRVICMAVDRIGFTDVTTPALIAQVTAAFAVGGADLSDETWQAYDLNRGETVLRIAKGA